MVKVFKDYGGMIYFMGANPDLLQQFRANRVITIFKFIDSEGSLMEKTKKKELNEILNEDL